jgi:hypothetical protein
VWPLSLFEMWWNKRAWKQRYNFMPGPVKIYDRPERTGPSPALLAVLVLIVLTLGYLLYRTFYRPAAAPPHANARIIHVRTAFQQEVQSHGEHEYIARYR